LQCGSGQVEANIYDRQKVKVARLEGPAGTVIWKGVNSNNTFVSSGIYFVEFTGSCEDWQKVVVLK
jgi:hypothetical protein